MALKINQGKQARAVKCVVYGSEGIGKSTFAAQFPDPLFIDTEGGTAQMDVRRIETPKNWGELVADVWEVVNTPGLCKTLVLDTADWAEQLCVAFILVKNNAKSIESFGYGKGYTYVAEEWQKLMAAFDACIAAGINVCIIAHAKMRKQELPDESGAFDRWEMKLSRQIAPLVKEWADMLLFLNYKTYVVADENGHNKAQGGQRVIYTSHSPVWDAKNRFGLSEMLPLEYTSVENVFRDQKKPIEALKQMMSDSGITEAELRALVASRGHYGEETPIEDYPDTFVTGWCTKYFDNIVETIKESKEA